MAVSSTSSCKEREHIEEIRRLKFSIGEAKPNPLTEDLHHAVKNLSGELYSKDVHFLMELIQNAEDNEYSSSVIPSLEFVITSKDVTGTGASATLLVFNNEVGFSKMNIESICSIGRSTKKGKRQEGFIGEKGIGFKSVFLISSQPYVFSNGYQISFTEEPDPCCGIGYIVPSWVEVKPSYRDIQRLYGSTLPNTVIILPLKAEKVDTVKKQLSAIHPEILLFLSKIKKLSVRESKKRANDADTISAISISSKEDFKTRKDVSTDSQMVYLSAEERSCTAEDCQYYIWRQRFPVKTDSRVESRKDIQEWVISLAFPFGERLKRGKSSAGIYAFLPTEMVTGFPFIIQADFILASSRETILVDNKWNLGILRCVPNAFTNAFVAAVKSGESAPVSSIGPIFKFLPISHSPFPALNNVQESIRTMLQAEYIIPCESSGNWVFRRPTEAISIVDEFQSTLVQLQDQGINISSISSHGKFILHPSLILTEDEKEFLRISELGYDWYGKCIRFQFLANGQDACTIKAESVFSLLQYIRKLLDGSCKALPDEFLCCIRSKWMKTSMGYKFPDECLLFNWSLASKSNDQKENGCFLFNWSLSSKSNDQREQASMLQPEDAPFIDEEFYGADIYSYKTELKAIGVKVVEGEGSEMLAKVLLFHTSFPTIKRIYGYLDKFHWKPESQSPSYIWIPINNGGSGEWVHSTKCVLSGKDNLFGSRFHILDKHYEKSLLSFFSSVLLVKECPSTDDYITLWNDWEQDSKYRVSNEECCAFWTWILETWSDPSKEIFRTSIRKLPTVSSTGEIQLRDKKKLFIADDLQLEQMFSQSSKKPLFVWCPQDSQVPIPLNKLYEVYLTLGVRKISETVQKDTDSFCIGRAIWNLMMCHLDLEFKDVLFGEGLLMLALGFLANPHFQISVKKRHEMIRPLIDLDVLVTDEPLTVCYSLPVSRTTCLNARANKMILWEKEAKCLVAWKPEKFDKKSNIEFAIHFGTAIAEGLLWEHPDLIKRLSKLINFGCAYGFNVDAMESLLKAESLQVYREDEEFLASIFPKCKQEDDSVTSLSLVTRNQSKMPRKMHLPLWCSGKASQGGTRGLRLKHLVRRVAQGRLIREKEKEDPTNEHGSS